jgi:2,5-furandicarboxylate decarboxylase 1
MSAKMGLDATRPLSYAGHTFTRVRVPGEEAVDLAKSLNPNPKAVLDSL